MTGPPPYVTSAETQAYIDEFLAPTIIGSGRNAIKQFAVPLNNMAQQAAIFATKLMSAELVETDTALDQLLGEAFLRLGAYRRSQEEVQRHLRDLADREQAFKDVNVTIRQRAQALGYARA